MSIRVIAPAGTDQTFPDLDSLLEAIRGGDVAPDALIFHAERERWIPAKEHPALQEAFRQDSQVSDLSDRPIVPRDASSSKESDNTKSNPGRSLEATGKSNAGPSQGITAVSWFVIIGAAAYQVHLAEPSGGAEAIGMWLGAIGGAFLLVAIFLAWSKTTRPYMVPAAALVAVVAAYGSNLNEQESQKLAERELNRVQQIADSTYSSVEGIDTIFETAGHSTSGAEAPMQDDPASVQESTGSEEPPSGTSTESKMLWVLRVTLEDLNEITQERAQRADIGNPPSAWMSPAWLARPSQHPEVNRYLEGLTGFLDWGNRRYPVLADSLVRIRFDQARIPDSYWSSVEDGLNKGLQYSFYSDRSVWGTLQEFAEAAGDLASYMEGIEDHTRYDSDLETVRFTHASHRQEAQELALRVDSLARAFVAAQNRDYGRFSTMMDSMRKLVDVPN